MADIPRRVAIEIELILEQTRAGQSVLLLTALLGWVPPNTISTADVPVLNNGRPPMDHFLRDHAR
jgi:hypothetical protein